MTAGTVIRILRASAGLTQTELAARVNISASFLSLLERDKREPTIRVLRAIGRALNVPPGVLVAAALADDDVEGSHPQNRKIADAIDHLVKAAYHLVLSERIDRSKNTKPDRPSNRRAELGSARRRVNA
jgi:transcriptional regulator with XRE-family HTH domain